MALTKIPASLLDTSSGFDLQGNITLGDNEQIQLGGSGDLAIYHDGSHSFITDSGTGNLRLQGTNLALQNAAGTKNYFLGSDGGAVTLYYNNDVKIATSSTGATVTGNLAVTGNLDITGDINSYNVTDLDVTDQTITLGAGQTEANSGGSGIIIDGSNASILWNETSNRFDTSNDLKVGAEDGGQFSLEVSGGATGTAEGGELRLNTAADYDGTYNHYRLDVFEDDFRIGRAGTTDITINSSGTVGINQGSPSSTYKLDVGGPIRSSGNAPSYTLREDDASSQTWLMASYGGTFAVRDTTVSGTAYPFQIEAATPSNTLFLDSSGKVGIGDTSPDQKLHVNSGASNVVAKFESTDSIAAIQFKDPNGEAEIGAIGNDIGFYPAGAEKVRITNSGHVGIGMTPAPVGSDTVLSLYNSATPRIKLHNSTTGTTSGDGAEINMSSSDFILENREAGRVRFFNNGSELMRLDTSGQVTLLGEGSSHAYTVPQDQSLGYTNNLNAGSFGILHRAAYDSYITGNSYYYRTGGSSSWRAKYGGYKSTVLGLLNGEFSFDCSNAAPGSNGAAVSGLANIVKINSDGISMAAGKGISFSANSHAAGMSSETLDDYEEGTWTPTINTGSGSITLDSSENLASYTKIGRMVYITGRLLASSVSSPSGSLEVTNLPFTVLNLGENTPSSPVVINLYNLAANIDGQINAEMSTGNSILIRDNGGTTGNVQNSMASHIGNGSRIGFTAVYVTSQ